MTDPRDLRTLDDDEPTAEEEALDFDPTSTDTLGAPHLTGGVERDERGQARWVVEPPRDAERTFDLLKALDSDKLSIEAETPAAPTAEQKPSAKSGYNPYATGPAKPLTKRR